MLRKIHNVILCAALILSLAPAVGWAQRVRVERKPKLIRNGKGTQPFDVTRHIIPLGKIQGGGPPRVVFPH